MRTNIKRYRKAKKGIGDEEEEHKAIISPAESVAHDDVLTEILLRLPIRSLLRSKCVSKHWRSLISDHRFAALRYPNPNRPRGLFLQRIANVGPPEYDFVPFDSENDVKPPFKTLNFDQNVSKTKSGTVILHASNGLMLCHSLHEHFNEKTKQIVYDDKYYVYNPTINQVATLPKQKNGVWAHRRHRGMTLAFDPSKSPHYKVICVRGYDQSDHLLGIEVYSSENRSWSIAGWPFCNQIHTEFTGGVFWNEAVHWINKNGYVFYLKINENHLDQTPIPIVREKWNVKKHCYPLVQSCDALLFIDVFPPPSLKLDVYEMDKDYSGWSVKYHIDLEEYSFTFPLSNNSAQHGFVWKPLLPFVIHSLVLGEREEDSFLVLEAPNMALRCNIEHKTCWSLCVLDSSSPFRFSVADDGFSKVGRWPGQFSYKVPQFRMSTVLVLYTFLFYWCIVNG